MTDSIITGIHPIDLRFPTSRTLDGSDAMNPDPDYSAAYVIITTDADDGLEGHGLTFTIGRGNELCVAAIAALAPRLIGRSTGALFADMGGMWRLVTGDSQLRWLGPEKGVIHLATAALVNAMWDLFAKREGLPLWRLVSEMPPETLVDCVDLTYLTDVLTRADCRAIVRDAQAGQATMRSRLLAHGFPAYTTSAGWIGYDDERIRRLCREALSDGWNAFKLKVGGDPADDDRRARIIREEIGPDRLLMIDANQRWDVPEAITAVRALAVHDPLFIEEPTSPDDILGHAAIRSAIAPVGVATGEHAHNRVMFKQLLQAGAITHCQIDAARLGGVNEVLAVLLLAARFDVPVWPHAGGVGLCEYVQHLSIIDALAVGGQVDGRRIEYVDHLHEHFLDPVRVHDGAYMVPEQPGYSIQIRNETLEAHRFPDGAVWVDAQD